MGSNMASPFMGRTLTRQRQRLAAIFPATRHSRIRPETKERIFLAARSYSGSEDCMRMALRVEARAVFFIVSSRERPVSSEDTLHITRKIHFKDTQGTGTVQIQIKYPILCQQFY